MNDSDLAQKNITRILLVDDSENDVMIIKDAFRRDKLACQIGDVRDGEAALKYLKKEAPYESAPTPGLILLDINMPKKNGFEVLEEIKKDALLKSIPVIMLTTSDREEDVLKSFREGACSFITKPGEIQKLVDLVQAFCIYWSDVSKVPRH